MRYPVTIKETVKADMSPLICIDRSPHNWEILKVVEYDGTYSHHVFYCTKCLAKRDQSM